MATTDKGWVNQGRVCTLPWFKMSIQGDYNIKPCCWINTTRDDKFLSLCDGDFYNSPGMVAVRKGILDGSYRECLTSECPYRQQGQLSAHEEPPENIMELLKHGPIVPVGPSVVECGFDPSCNLACPSCRKEYIRRPGDQAQLIIDKLNVLPGIKRLWILNSGDPFASPVVRKWLRTISDKNLIDLEGITIHTNGQLVSPSMWESLSVETRLLIRRVFLSIDAAHPYTYAGIRRGGDFQVLRKNLDFLARLRKQGLLDWIELIYVVQRDNFKELPDAIRLAEEIGVDRIMPVFIGNWGTFTEKEFLSIGVHLYRNTQHSELIKIMEDPTLGHSIVDTSRIDYIRKKV